MLRATPVANLPKGDQVPVVGFGNEAKHVAKVGSCAETPENARRLQPAL